MSAKQSQQSHEDSSSSYGWLVGLAIVTIVGIAVWMVVANNEDAI